MPTMPVLPGLTVDPGHPRLARTRALGRPSTTLRYVRGDRARLVERLGVLTVRDCLAAVPMRYLDFSQLSSVLDANVGDEVTVIARVDEVTVKHPRPKLTVVEVGCYDSTGTMVVTYFGQPWMQRRFHEGQLVAFSGKVGFSFGFKRMNAPFSEVLADSVPEGDVAGVTRSYSARIIPVYHATEGLSAAWAKRIAAAAVNDFGDVCDFWGAAWRRGRGLMSLGRAVRCAHAPHELADAELARRRLAYDEAVFLQLGMRISRDAHIPGVEPVAHVTDGPATERVMGALPFPLTDDQRRAVGEILADMAAPRSMCRLLLGDVGTGKTLVATCLFGAVADTGTQAAVMAPTGVLAAQYATKVGPILDRAGIAWALLTGATSARERSELLGRLADGSVCVLFGTHALLNSEVTFRRLSLVVIDEQQRFGVAQRRELRQKGRGADLLVMTATPIPRTLALSVYGDLDCSYVRQRPNPGAGVTTRVISRRDRGLAYEAMREAIAQGHQAYVVCPLIGTTPGGRDGGQEGVDEAADSVAAGGDPSDARAAENEAVVLQRRVFPDARVGLLTGRMSATDKQRVMSEFRDGQIQVLVSTTVIEVGVDVPNATVMLIEDGERFGLAQLHQLRGRVGRGDWPGTVYIATSGGSRAARDRLGALERTDDGFELAKEDLRIRHEGELLGSRQSGDVTLRFVDLSRDEELLERARTDAVDLLSRDPGFEGVENRPVRDELVARFGDVFREVSGG